MMLFPIKFSWDLVIISTVKQFAINGFCYNLMRGNIMQPCLACSTMISLY